MPRSTPFAWHASKRSPCPVCGRVTRCDSPDLALYLCRTRKDDTLPVAGFTFRGMSADREWGVWLRDGAAPTNGHANGQLAAYASGGGPNGHTNGVPVTPAKASPPAVRPPFAALAAAYQEAAAHNGAVADLAARLNVSVESLQAIGCGWCHAQHGGCWTFPERNAAGEIVGIGFRLRSGQKKQYAGGRRGIIVPSGLAERVAQSPVASGVLLAVEGPSDVAACLTMGIAAVGRPNNAQGGREIVEMIAAISTLKTLVIVGENDRREDGRWPGAEGARRVFREIGSMSKSECVIAFPPESAKDTRAYLAGCVQNVATAEKSTLYSAGSDYGKHLINDFGRGNCNRFSTMRSATGFDGVFLHSRESVAIETDEVSNSFGPAACRVIDSGQRAGWCPRHFSPLLTGKSDARRAALLAVDCRGWLCSECVSKNRLRWLVHIFRCLHEADGGLRVWRGTEGDWPAFRLFRHRKEPGEFVRLVTSAGLVVVTTVPHPAAEVVEIDAAVERFAEGLEALDLEAWKPVTTSRAWAMTPESTSSEWHRDGQAPRGRFQSRVEMVRDAGLSFRLTVNRNGRRCQWRFPDDWSEIQVESFRMHLKED